MGANSNVLRPAPGDALIIVDVQRDFLAGGSIAVPEASGVIAPINHMIEIFERLRLPVFATRDWHPANHRSFLAQGGIWPPHCVAGTSGARFDPRLLLPHGVRIVSKGRSPDKEAYSAFQGTDLHQKLHSLGVSRLYVGGLATEYCILDTAKDATALGYQVVLLLDAIRAAGAQPGDEENALNEMSNLGIIPILAPQILGPYETPSRAA